MPREKRERKKQKNKKQQRQAWCRSIVLGQRTDPEILLFGQISVRTKSVSMFPSLPALEELRMGSPDWNVSMVDIHLQKLL